MHLQNINNDLLSALGRQLGHVFLFAPKATTLRECCAQCLNDAERRREDTRTFVEWSSSLYIDLASRVIILKI